MRSSVRHSLVAFVLMTAVAGRVSLFVLPTNHGNDLAMLNDALPIINADMTGTHFSVSFDTTFHGTSTGRLIWRASEGKKAISGYDITLSGENIAFEIGDGENSYATIIPAPKDTEPHKIVAVFSREKGQVSGTAKLFVDSSSTGIVSGELGTIPTNKPIFIGTEYGANKQFDGDISNVMFYDKTLSDAEISHILSQGKSK